MKKRILGVVAAALLLAGLAGADSNTYNYQGTGPYFNARNGARVNSTGSALVDDVSRDRDASFTETNIIAAGALAGTSNLAAGAADSSAVLDTRHMRLGMLVIKCVPAGGGAGLITRLAISVRTHVNGAADSVSTAPIYFYGNAPVMVATTAVADTAAAGHLFAGSATGPWSGEYVVTVNGARNAPASAVAATAFSYPNAICIPLTNLWGREIFSPWTSVRVRNITGPAAQVYVSLVGTPL